MVEQTIKLLSRHFGASKPLHCLLCFLFIQATIEINDFTMNMSI